jgi:2-isopropylmalate synthase
MLQLTERAVLFAVDHGLSVLYVNEDTTRSSPEMLAALYGAAIRSGASRICLADTVGHATPAGTRALVRFVRRLVNECDERVGIDWHGHSDRGLALANSLAAWEAGAERCHGTALGIGERSGNTPIELLLANLVLLERRTSDLTLLPAYVRTAASALGFNIAPHHPIVGRDAFRTATGTHAAAIVRAEESGDSWAAERIYSGVPASWVGRDQVIEIGPLSGEANVVHWLRNRGIDLEEGLVETVLDAAKHSDDVLNEAQIKELVSQHREIQARERTGINTTKARSVSRLLFQASAARQQARRSSR